MLNKLDSTTTSAELFELSKEAPSTPLSNVIFKNKGNLEFEKVNLSNMAMDVNLDFEFIENGFLLAGYRMLTSEGNEYTSIRIHPSRRSI